MNTAAHGFTLKTAAFWLGTLAVMAGVALHLPMFLMGASTGYRMVGMPMDAGMLFGMFLIIAGTFVAGYGLLLRQRARVSLTAEEPRADAIPAAASASDTRLTAAHWKLMGTLTLALIIDTMKPASLGFVLPGAAAEYGIARPTVALLPFFALIGTAVGSVVWGMLADKVGRRSAILLAAIMFVGTSICGAMPTFAWNIVMCFFMGASAGGMLPIAYTLLAETIPARHRRWFLVLFGGLGLLGGYLAASTCAAILQPLFSWRILWLAGFPTGLLLIALSRFIPELPRFLLAQGRVREAQDVLKTFGVGLQTEALANRTRADILAQSKIGTLFRGSLAGVTYSLNLAAFTWGLVNFGLLLWLPSELRASGLSGAVSDALLARSTLLALPTTVLASWAYARWSTKWTLVLFLSLTSASLIALWLVVYGLAPPAIGPAVPITLLLIGANGIIAVLLPYSAEAYMTLVRGRGTGLVAGNSKAGGILAQIASMASIVPGLALGALTLAVPMALAAVLIGNYGTKEKAPDTGSGALQQMS